MVSFTRDRPVKTRQPGVVVDAGLEPGLHRFRLEVVAEDGRGSRQAAEVTLEVTRDAPPARPGLVTEPPSSFPGSPP
jgi:hypothetical protein